MVAVAPEVCAVMGGKPVPSVYFDYEGHRFFFCCSGCPARFEEDPMTYIEKLRRTGISIEIDKK